MVRDYRWNADSVIPTTQVCVVVMYVLQKTVV